jgi:hypothetical protein
VLAAPGHNEPVDVGGVTVRRLPAQHVGFLVASPGPVLHVGDADPAADNFAVLESLVPVDVALLPFWYVADESNRRFVAHSIHQRRIVAMHIPPRDADKIREALRGQNCGQAIFEELGRHETVAFNCRRRMMPSIVFPPRDLFSR